MSTYLGMAQRTQSGGLEVSMLTFYYDELSSILYYQVQNRLKQLRK